MPSKRVMDLTGKIFNGITVLSVVGRNRQGNATWKCRCHCGKEFVASQSHLTRKTMPVKSCGCAHFRHGDKHHQWNGAGLISGGWWYTHVLRERDQTARTKLPVTVTVEQAWGLFLEQKGRCALTNTPLEISNVHERNTASVDRIDSSKGYVFENIQWVHKHLNFMKRTYSQDYFIEMCGSVYLKHRGTNG